MRKGKEIDQDGIRAYLNLDLVTFSADFQFAELMARDIFSGKRDKLKCDLCDAQIIFQNTFIKPKNN